MDSGSDITFATSNTNWCEIEVERLAENARFFKSLVGSSTILAVAVKANAYGHGLRIAADAFVSTYTTKRTFKYLVDCIRLWRARRTPAPARAMVFRRRGVRVRHAVHT